MHLSALRHMLTRMGVQYAFELNPTHVRIYIRGNGRDGFVSYPLPPPDADPVLWHLERDVCRTLGLEPHP